MVVMSFSQAVEAIKERTLDYLKIHRGITVTGRYQNGTSHAFHCINPSHTDKNASMFYSYEGHYAVCRTCKAKYGIFDLIEEDYGLHDFKDQVKKGAELYGIQIDETPRRIRPKEDAREMDGTQAKAGRNTDTQPHAHEYTHTHKPEEDRTAYFEACKRRLAETDYHRGLSLKTLERHGVGFDPHFRTRGGDGNFVEWKALIIPTGGASFAARNTDTTAGHTDRYRKRGAEIHMETGGAGVLRDVLGRTRTGRSGTGGGI